MSSYGQSYGQGFFSPEDVATEQGLRRRQAYAQALLQGDTPQGAYGGLAAAGNKLLGAFLSNRTDAKEADLAKSSQDRYVSDARSIYGGESQSPVSSTSQAMGAALKAPQISNAGGPDMPVDTSQGPQRAPTGAPMGMGGQAPMPQQMAQAAPQSPMSRLLGTGNAALIQQLAPQLFTHQLGREDSQADYQRNRSDLVHDKTMRELTPEESKARGLRGRWQVDAFGALHEIEKPDTLTPEAERQKIRIAEAGKSNYGGLGGSSVFSTIDTPNGMYALDRSGKVSGLNGPDGKPLVSYHSDVPLRFQMGAAGAGGKAAGAVAEALPAAESTFTSMQDTIKELKTPEMRKQAGYNTGLMGLTGMGRIPGVGSDFANKRDQFADQVFLQGFNALKGAGAITDKEGSAATNAYTRIKKAQTYNEFYQSLDDADALIARTQNAIRERAHRGAVVPQLGGGQPQSAPQGNNDPLGLRR